MSTSELEPVRHEVAVDLPLEEAFARFVDDLGAWWPPEYTWSGEELERIAIEPRLEGACVEEGADGTRAVWGTVAAWEPPRRLALTWQIGPDREPETEPERSSEVELTFSGEHEGPTKVELEHRGFERHGEGAAEYREAMAADHGWPYILSRYASAP